MYGCSHFDTYRHVRSRRVRTRPGIQGDTLCYSGVQVKERSSDYVRTPDGWRRVPLQPRERAAACVHCRESTWNAVGYCDLCLGEHTNTDEKEPTS